MSAEVNHWITDPFQKQFILLMAPMSKQMLKHYHTLILIPQKIQE